MMNWGLEWATIWFWRFFLSLVRKVPCYSSQPSWKSNGAKLGTGNGRFQTVGVGLGFGILAYVGKWIANANHKNQNSRISQILNKLEWSKDRSWITLENNKKKIHNTPT